MLQLHRRKLYRSDDGEECVCVQSISYYCAGGFGQQLPHKELETALFHRLNAKKCAVCGAVLVPTEPRLLKNSSAAWSVSNAERHRACKDRYLYDYIFNDNRQNPLMDKAHAYVENWKEAYKEHMGFLLFGDVGTSRLFRRMYRHCSTCQPGCACADAILNFPPPKIPDPWQDVLRGWGRLYRQL